MSEAVNIPQLRFPEFNGAWEEKKLGEVVRYTKGFAFKSNDYVDSGVRIIRVSDLGAESIKKDNKSIYLSSENEHLYDKWKIRKNNIVITTVGSNPDLIESAVGRGIFIINDNEGLLNQNMLKLENSTQVNNKFVHCFINSPKYIHHIKAIKRGNANQANITVKELLDFKLSITTKPEQQKIAAFLNAVDTKIEQLSKKQELLGEYKKGLMQQIFSQVIRFKADDGSEFPDWEERVLGDYLAHKSKKNKNNEVDLVLSVSNKKGFITQDEQFDGYQVASKDLTNYKIVEKGEYAYNPSRINVGSIARLKNNTIGIVSPMYVVFKLKNLDSIFFDNLYQTHLFKHLIKVGCSGSVRDSLNFNDMADFVFSFPSLEEQAKIANFLSSIDSKIEQVGKQLDESKQFKKALLQQMFV